jgi:hypothetical protein
VRFFGFMAIAVAAFSQATPAIPDPVALLQDIVAHQHKMDEVRENYTFHRIRRTDDLDKNGVVTKTETTEREIFFVNGRRVGRLVKKDGIELSAQEQRAEQNRINKEVPRLLKLPAPKERQSSELSDLLAVAKISNPRRLSRNGRATLAFDFAGDPKARAHGMDQNIAKKIAGTIWIDEADRQVARLEVRFDDNFHLGGGLLASIQKGTTFAAEQSPVGQGLWLETSSEEHVSARLLVKNFRQNVHVQDVDFKRFDVGVLEHINPPSP